MHEQPFFIDARGRVIWLRYHRFMRKLGPMRWTRQPVRRVRLYKYRYPAGSFHSKRHAKWARLGQSRWAISSAVVR